MVVLTPRTQSQLYIPRNKSLTPSEVHKATLKKKFVSGPVGGQNCGQSGGRKIFFSPFFFGKKTVKIKKNKKGFQSALVYTPGH